jgi:hypothetical protein
VISVFVLLRPKFGITAFAHHLHSSRTPNRICLLTLALPSHPSRRVLVFDFQSALERVSGDRTIVTAGKVRLIECAYDDVWLRDSGMWIREMRSNQSMNTKTNDKRMIRSHLLCGHTKFGLMISELLMNAFEEISQSIAAFRQNILFAPIDSDSSAFPSFLTRPHRSHVSDARGQHPH